MDGKRFRDGLYTPKEKLAKWADDAQIYVQLKKLASSMRQPKKEAPRGR